MLPGSRLIPGLANDAMESGKLLWKLRPKYHKFLGWCCVLCPGVSSSCVSLMCIYLRLDHIVWDQAPQISPLHASCYMDEDGMGQIRGWLHRPIQFPWGTLCSSAIAPIRVQSGCANWRVDDKENSSIKDITTWICSWFNHAGSTSSSFCAKRWQRPRVLCWWVGKIWGKP